MAAAQTYFPIATTSLGGSSSVTWSSLGTYTDLRVIFNGGASDYLAMQFNGDTGTNYSRTNMWGVWSTSGVYSDRQNNESRFYLGDPANTMNNWSIIDIMNASNSTTYKPILARSKADANSRLYYFSEMWRSTSAVTSIKFYPNSGTFTTGSTATIYGIVAA